MRRILRIFLFLIGLGFLFSAWVLSGPAKDYERELLVAETQENLRVVSRDRLENASDALVALLCNHREKAFDVGEQFPQEENLKKTEMLFKLFEMDQDFQWDIKWKSPLVVVPVVWEFYAHEHLSIDIKMKLSEVFGRSPELASLTPEQREKMRPVLHALYVIKRIRADSNFLQQFVVDEKTMEVHRLKTERALSYGKKLVQGLVNFEKQGRLKLLTLTKTGADVAEKIDSIRTTL